MGGGSRRKLGGNVFFIYLSIIITCWLFQFVAGGNEISPMEGGVGGGYETIAGIIGFFNPSIAIIGTLKFH